MTIEILYLTTQVQRWLNARVARHLAEQTARLTPKEGATMTSRRIASASCGADGSRRSASEPGCIAMSDFYGPAADDAASIAPIDAVIETGSGKPTVHA